MSAFAVGALFVGMTLLGPHWYKKETELRCDPGWKLVAVYPDITKCSAAMPTGRQCGCSSLQNEWAPLYSNYFAPVALGIVAWFLLRGARLMRVAWLNIGFWGSILIMGVYYAFTNAEGVEGLVLVFGHFIYVVLVASVVLIASDLFAHGIAQVLRKRAQS